MRSLGLMVVLTVLNMLLGILVAVLHDPAEPRMAHRRLGRAAAGLGDAAADGDRGVGLDLRHRSTAWSTGRSTPITGTSDWTNHSWLLNPWSFFFVLTIIIVWQRVPFVAFTTYAALGQVPGEVLEAASARRRDRPQALPASSSSRTCAAS